MWITPDIDITKNTPFNLYLGSDKFNLEMNIEAFLAKGIVSLRYSLCLVFI